jgi:hypothetical protein
LSAKTFGDAVINVQEIEAAQRAWGEGVVGIGAAPSWSDAYERAVAFVTEFYALGDEALLFCPTKAREAQFRATLEDAVSYFVGRDPRHAEDGGFALAPWVSVRFENAGVVCRDGIALAMGNYFFKGEDGLELKVEYSFAYVRGPEGALQVQLHHSALPYSG